MITAQRPPLTRDGQYLIHRAERAALEAIRNVEWNKKAWPQTVICVISAEDPSAGNFCVTVTIGKEPHAC